MPPNCASRAAWTGRVVAGRSRAEHAAVAATDRAAAGGAFAAAATPLAMGVSVLGVTADRHRDLRSRRRTPADDPDGAGHPRAAAAVRVRGHGRAARRGGRAVPGAGRGAPDMAVLDAAVGVSASPGRADTRTARRCVAKDLRCGWPGGQVTAPLDLDLTAGRPGRDRRRAAASGKTTAADDAGRVAPPGVGDGAGRWARRLPGQIRRRSAGTSAFFAEDAHLFDTSVLENLRVARGDLRSREAPTGLRVGRARGMGVEGCRRACTRRCAGGDRAVSGGQRRRMLLARALLSPARVLLLDEPTEHLDADAGADLLRRLLARDGGLVSAQRTVVVVTHQLPEDTSADLVIRVEKAERENALPTP